MSANDPSALPPHAPAEEERDEGDRSKEERPADGLRRAPRHRGPVERPREDESAEGEPRAHDEGVVTPPHEPPRRGEKDEPDAGGDVLLGDERRGEHHAPGDERGGGQRLDEDPAFLDHSAAPSFDLACYFCGRRCAGVPFFVSSARCSPAAAVNLRRARRASWGARRGGLIRRRNPPRARRLRRSPRRRPPTPHRSVRWATAPPSMRLRARARRRWRSSPRRRVPCASTFTKARSSTANPTAASPPGRSSRRSTPSTPAPFARCPQKEYARRGTSAKCRRRPLAPRRGSGSAPSTSGRRRAAANLRTTTSTRTETRTNRAGATRGTKAPSSSSSDPTPATTRWSWTIRGATSWKAGSPPGGRTGSARARTKRLRHARQHPRMDRLTHRTRPSRPRRVHGGLTSSHATENGPEAAPTRRRRTREAYHD